ESEPDVAVEGVAIEVEGGGGQAADVGGDRLPAADARAAAPDEPGDRELAVLRERDAQLGLSQQDVGSVERVGIPAQVLVGEDEQLVRRDRPGRDAGPAVAAQRSVL